LKQLRKKKKNKRKKKKSLNLNRSQDSLPKDSKRRWRRNLPKLLETLEQVR